VVEVSLNQLNSLNNDLFANKLDTIFKCSLLVGLLDRSNKIYLQVCECKIKSRAIHGF
jgi:hypothetical protein